MEKSDNSGSVLISAVFETREDLDSQKMFWSKVY